MITKFESLDVTTFSTYFFAVFQEHSYLGQDGCQNEPVILQVDFTLMKIEEPTTYTLCFCRLINLASNLCCGRWPLDLFHII